MRYSALHCGQATRAVLLPRCFSSTHRCRHAWWTHLVEPRQRHGRTHSAVRSSSSVAKHTQQLLKQTHKRVIVHYGHSNNRNNFSKLMQVMVSIYNMLCNIYYITLELSIIHIHISCSVFVHLTTEHLIDHSPYPQGKTQIDKSLCTPQMQATAIINTVLEGSQSWSSSPLAALTASPR